MSHESWSSLHGVNGGSVSAHPVALVMGGSRSQMIDSSKIGTWWGKEEERPMLGQDLEGQGAETKSERGGGSRGLLQP